MGGKSNTGEGGEDPDRYIQGRLMSIAPPLKKNFIYYLLKTLK